MFCSKCGEPAVQDAKFCAKCGVSLLLSAPPTAQPETKPITEIVSVQSPVRPWVRYWARMFDVYSFTLFGGVILVVIAPQFFERQNEYAVGMMLVFAWVFVESFLLSTFQTTPGKWLFKTKIALTSGLPINFSQALARSFKVWWRGFGTGFPIATMITMIIAHGRLTRNGITSWDKDDGFSVTHETIGVLRVLAAIAFFFIFLVFVAIGSIVSTQAPKVPKAGTTFKDCADCPDMVVIPAGSFEMGLNGLNADEKPAHQVHIGKAYALGKTEITKGQFAAFVNATSYDAGNACWVFITKMEEVSGKNWSNPGHTQTDNHPVACINWNDAKAYTSWLSRKTGKAYQLPSEAQWEYACRAGGSHTYCGSDDIDNIAWYGRKNGYSTQPTAQKQANAFGLYDMSGNLWEWTEDSYHANYNGAPTDGSVWQGDGAERVLRGGSWYFYPQSTHAAGRYRFEPVRRGSNIGFRLARMLP